MPLRVPNSFCLIGASLLLLGSQAGRSAPTLPIRPVFPADNAWNRDVSKAPVDPNSAALIAAMNPSHALHCDFGTPYQGRPNGIPYMVVSGNQPLVPVTFQYAGESDPGPYPIPPDAPIEGGPDGDGDRHVLVLDRDHWKLYETWDSHPNGKGGWRCGSGAIFDLSSDALRPAGWTSADAAGLPVFPGLVRYDEMMEKQEVTHAIRFTVRRSRRAYVAPARHFASRLTDANLPPMGMRVRLKSSVDISGFSPTMQVLLRALKRYGLILADNGSDWFLSGAPDPRWNDDDLGTIRRLHGSDFEVVKRGEVVTQ